jgi:hypothetical protein
MREEGASTTNDAFNVGDYVIFDRSLLRIFQSLLTSHPSPEPAKEGAQIFGQELRFFSGRKMAAARHFGPMLHIVPALDPDSRRERQFFGKMGNSGGRVDEFPFPELQRRFSAFKIQAERRVNRLRHPVEGYIR